MFMISNESDMFPLPVKKYCTPYLITFFEFFCTDDNIYHFSLVYI